MTKNELTHFLQNRPSVVRNMLLMQTLKGLSYILMWVCFILSATFFINWLFGMNLTSWLVSSEIQECGSVISNVSFIFGLISLLFSLLFLTIRWVISMVLVRNSYLIELETGLNKYLSSSSDIKINNKL